MQMDISDVFEQITGGKYAVFVTCGYVPTEQYKEKLEKNLEVWYPDEEDLENAVDFAIKIQAESGD